MSIYISHLYVELDINVIIVSFDVIFIEKFVIGESGIFLGFLYLYRKKVVWIGVLDLVVWWVKMLNLVGFYDIECDIWILIGKLVKCLILLGLIRFLFRC